MSYPNDVLGLTFPVLQGRILPYPPQRYLMMSFLPKINTLFLSIFINKKMLITLNRSINFSISNLFPIFVKETGHYFFMNTQTSLADKREIVKTPAEICRAVNADFKLQGLTHAEAAKKLGVECRSVSNQLSGKRPFAKKGALLYARVFGYDETFLLFGTGELKKSRKTTDVASSLASRYAGRMDAGLFEELYEVFSKLEILEEELQEAQEANQLMEKEIARLTAMTESFLATK